ncbi:MAG: glycosyltransferase family 9 protein [Candidatus Omnitrophota bacterium]
MPEKKRILIINPFGIGDVLFSTPLIRNLRFYFPDAFIAVAVQKRILPVLENNPYINKIIPFSRGDFKKLSRKSKIRALRMLFGVINQVRRQRFNLYFDLSLEHRYSLLLKLFGVKPRIGYNYKKRGRFLTDRIDILGYKDKHVAEYHLELLKFLTLKPRFTNIDLFLSQEQKDWAGNFLKQEGVNRGDLLVGIAPFGGETFGKQAEIKHWPIEKYAQICDLLIDRLKAKVIILAGPKEEILLGRLFSFMRNKAISAAQTSIIQLASIVDRCKLIISNDTGPLRFANALGIPTISLFGPVDEKVYGPYPSSVRNVVLKKDFDCRPCYQYFRTPDCQYQLRCLAQISTEEVFQAAERLLE